MIRRQRTSDRRRVGLFVTNDGLRVLESVREQRTAWLASRLEELSPEDFGALRAALGPLDLVSMGDR